MNLSAPFVRRPVGTMLMTIAVLLVGLVSFRYLPVAALPQVEFPTINVSASLPGASPETMASSVAAPLERQFTRIAGVTEMTSSSTIGGTNITLQFELHRDIDGAARDVQAAINAARADLPSNLPTSPSYRKVNPSDGPILILALTSELVTRGQMYDAASSILQQKLSQVEGVGQVAVGGGSLPAIRVDLNPTALNKYGIGLGEVRQALAATNVNRPKGQLTRDDRTWEIRTNDQLHKVEDYLPLIVAYRDGRAVQLSDVATVEHSVEDLRTMGVANGTPAVLVIIYRQAGANIIETVDRLRARLPQLEASLPGSISLSVVMDRTPVIRASLHDVERTLLISVGLVILVVFLFLRNVRATLIPSVAVPVSLIGTFGVMYLCGYSLDNLSLMALTIATGFVVDDAIVVLENITRYREQAVPPMEAALRGARDIAFTVVSMTLSLVAVFIPIFLMGGMLGRLFREFAVTLSVAILVSLVVSLTTIPMLCARVLPAEGTGHQGWWARAGERLFEAMRRGYAASLRWVLRHPRTMLAVTLATMALTVYLYILVPKGFFPQQDTGRLFGNIQAAQDISFQAMRDKLAEVVDIIKSDPAVATVTGFTGGGGHAGTTNTGRMFIALKPLEERGMSSDQVIARLRPKLAKVPGAPTYLQPIQDLRIGGRASSAQYQYTLQSVDLAELNTWSPIVEAKLRTLPELVDVNSDQQDRGQQSLVVFDRATASRLGLSPQLIDDTLYDAFGQRQVSIMYTPLNQYHVVMEVAPQYWQNPAALHDIYVRAPNGGQVPLSAVTRYEPTNTILSVNHQGQFPAVTLSFNMAPGVSLGVAVQAIDRAMHEINLPAAVRGTFQGTAKAFQSSVDNQPWLILAALVTVYIVLGILYESYVHPITILSTLPSAGVGALLALLLFKTELSMIALIGIMLLIGIVKKNAIMMIDFALQSERAGEGKSPEAAIYEACLLRFRPIMMTTLAALLGALPLALGTGVGSELRRPLGIAIVGGLLVSQVLTLYTTPVVYLFLDRLRLRWARIRAASLHPAA
ncbi:MAG: Multidrug resistance protein MdtC [Nitrospirae bacterium]|nr:Multidrug resistance protein MdtC [Nitrospirota bacterium]MCE7965410.1 multidrug efflux RND transporter permease subunit [Nitrospira sp. NTP2]MCK6493037.1 multidrug efflux RND transporter permease subunit [Nitrospira sp.]MEB2338384.1 multidrug efflux RND transporter permease subunit [Nitrospirales bacterium]QOJ36203.1 MAG: multidrug efflux RND transporter permease subunit [Nitrospira sp.]